MHSANILCSSLKKAPLYALLILLAACGGSKRHEVTELEQAQASKCYADAGTAVFMRQDKDALDYMEQAVKLNPYAENYWLELGKARLRLKDVSGASVAYKKSLAVCVENLAINPNSTSGLFNHIAILVMLNHVPEARDALKQANKIYPDDMTFQMTPGNSTVDRLCVDLAFSRYVIKE